MKIENGEWKIKGKRGRGKRELVSRTFCKSKREVRTLD